MNNNTYDEIIASLDRIIATQERIMDRLMGMDNKIRELNDNISSENNIVEKWDTTGPR
jgi:hypothetical protein